MIARTSALVGAASGSIGSVTFKNARSGLVIAKRPSKVNRRSERQLTHRSRFQRVTQAWRETSAAQRIAWTRLATTLPHKNSLGISRPLTGYQLYLKFNLHIALVTNAIFPRPPTGLVSVPVISMSLDFEEEDHYEVTCEMPVVTTDNIQWMYFGRTFSTSRPKFFDNFTYFGQGSFTQGSSMRDFFPDLDAVQGSPRVGEWVYFRMWVSQNDLWPSLPLDVATQVTG